MLLAFLAGVLLKVYDDFVDDDPILTNEYGIAALRTLQIAVTTLVLAGDFWLCLLFTIFNAVCALSSWVEYSQPHVVSYAVVSPLLLAVSWPHRPSLRLSDLGGLIGAIGVALFEPKAFPEETSWIKGISRFLVGWGLLTAALVLRQISSSARTALVLFGGYSVASSMAQMLKVCPSGLSRASPPTPA
jgi:hypothetical protein